LTIDHTKLPGIGILQAVGLTLAALEFLILGMYIWHGTFDEIADAMKVPQTAGTSQSLFGVNAEAVAAAVAVVAIVTAVTVALGILLAFGVASVGSAQLANIFTGWNAASAGGGLVGVLAPVSALFTCYGTAITFDLLRRPVGLACALIIKAIIA